MPSDDRALLLSVSADIRNLERQMRRAGVVVDQAATGAERRTQTMAGRMNRSLGAINGDALRRGIERSSAAAGVAFGAIIAYSVRAAANAAETANAFEVAFASQTRAAQRFADSYSREVGRSVTGLQAQMAQVQLVLTGVGVEAGRALELTTQITRRAVDIGSLWNVDEADAFRAIISGINGEAEPMRRFGVAMNEAAVNAELLRMGITGGARAATQAQVAQARLAFIIRQTSNAQGDATNTAGSLVNQTRRLQAEFEGAAVTFGQRFLPVALRVVTWANDALGAFTSMPPGLQNAGLAMLALVAAGGPIMSLVGGLRAVVGAAVAARASLLAVAGAGAAAGAAQAGAGAVGGAAAGAGIVAGGFAAAGAAIGGGIIFEGNQLGRAAEIARNPQGRSATELAGAARVYRRTVGGVNGRQVAERLEALAAQRMFAPDGNALNDFVRRQGMSTAARLAGGGAAPAGGGGRAGGGGGRSRRGAGSGAGRSGRERAEAQGHWEIIEGQGGNYEWVFVNPDGTRAPIRLARLGEGDLIEADHSRGSEALRNIDPDDLDPQQILEVAQSVQLIGENFGQQLIEDMERASETLERGITGALEAGVRGGWPGLVEYMTNMLIQRMIDGLGSNLASILSNAGGAPGSGGGGLFGAAARGVGWLFGVGRNAEGTNSWRGGMSLVGEKGPELVNLPRGAQVIPNSTLKGMAGLKAARSPTDLRLNMNINLEGANGDATIRRISAEAAAKGAQWAVAQARRQAPGWVAQRQREGR